MKIINNNNMFLNLKDLNKVVREDDIYKRMYEFTFFNICFELAEYDSLDEYAQYKERN